MSTTGSELSSQRRSTSNFSRSQGKQDGMFVTMQDPVSHDLRSRVESLQFP